MPSPSHRAPVPGERRPSRVGASLVAAALVVATLGGVALAQAGAERARTVSEDVVPPAQTVVDSASVLPQRRVVPATEVAEVDREALRAERAARRAAERAAKEAARAERGTAPAAEQDTPFEVRVGTFNVLGSQHTAPGGDRQKYPPAATRNVGAANLIAKHGVDVLGTQELQADQLRALQSRTGMAAYPGFAWGEMETDNSVLWDPGVFELVSGDQFTLTFMGTPRPQPVVRLRHLATGRELYVVNTHPSAGDGQYAAERANGQDALVSVVDGLADEGLPILVTGDMNDREAFYCSVVPRAGLTASNGGSYANGCVPPPGPLPVDWVVGSGASWSGYWRDTTPVTQRISDHFFISALARVG